MSRSSLKNIADELGLHPSTISRILRSKYIQTPKGILPLKSLLINSVSKTRNVTPVQLMEIIKKIIETEKSKLSDQAISIIGNSDSTGSGVELLAENDVIFNGDMQKWKQLANSLKLRLALRANGAPGEDFSAATISDAIASGVLANDNALFERDQEINQWAGGAVYGDIIGGFPAR